MSSVLQRRLGVGTATAMIVTEVLGVGLFLTPASIARTLGSAPAVVAVWTLIALLSIAGALCLAELGSRFPEAGGLYVYLREAFGERVAFLYGWMSLLVMDPGLAAALGVGLARYLLIVGGGSSRMLAPLAIACVLLLSGVTLLGANASARVLRWTAAVKLVAIVAIVAAVATQRGDGPASSAAAPPLGFGAAAGVVLSAFFAFGGWWDLGKLGEELERPRRTLPIALIGGIVVALLVYGALSLAFLRGAGAHPSSDDAFVATLGASLFGRWATPIFGGAVAVAVAGSLAAVLFGAPRVYLAMARSGVFPAALVRFDARRQSAPRATLVQVALACLLVAIGSFDEIIGYFVPAAVLFLGVAAAAILRLPRPAASSAVFRAPLHPLPILLFLLLVLGILALFVVGRPMQTLTGLAVIALGIPVSYRFVRPRTLALDPSPGD